ncbi:ion transporter [Marilutibacter maris]|uniref:Ion transport family protein n=1 Tax=Marilutibacter maris TaxID=1605891 RepID=A0A2U9TC41_9GAMM|nr:ion transporter [Lysobacter maris]AWV08424.1 ion transport family protein [Lysobacter maris]KAB8198352.1 ion transporter [Lysobacter maris]
MRLLFAPQLNPATETGWRRTWFDIIYRHDTPPSRNFDLILVFAIFTSVLVIMFDSVPHIHQRFSESLYVVEWAFTLLFTAEYALRLMVVRRPLRYALSVWGLIDLLSILPTYLSLLLPGSQSLLVVRILRILRLFRILKLTQYVEEGGILIKALWRSRRKIFVFLCAIMTVVVIFGALMYLIEGPQHGFTSIPTGMYWAIVTMATVGYGDISPETVLGRFFASILILIGYSVIAVPTGIYTAELASSLREASGAAGHHDARGCPECGLEGHDPDALHCRHCGHPLPAAMG